MQTGLGIGLGIGSQGGGTSAFSPGDLSPDVWLDANSSGVLFSDQSGTTPAVTLVRRINGVNSLGYASGNPSDSQAARIDTVSYGGETSIYVGGAASPFTTLNGWSFDRRSFTAVFDYCSVGNANDLRGLIGNTGESLRFTLREAVVSSNQYYLQTSDNDAAYNFGPNDPSASSGRRVVIFRGTSTGQKLRLNGVSLTDAAAMSSETVINSFLGSISSTSAMQGPLREVVLFNRVISDGEVSQLEDYFSQRTATACPISLPLAVCDGDSITFGFGVNTINRWTVYAETNIGHGAIRVADVATSGFQWSNMQSRSTAVVDVWYSSSRTKNICVCMGATNALISGSSAATVFSQALTYIQARKAIGWAVIVGTCLPSVLIDGAKETARVSYNALVLSNAIAEGYTVADVAAISEMSDPNNATYYSDGTHPTAAGQALLSNDPTNGFATKISSLL